MEPNKRVGLLVMPLLGVIGSRAVMPMLVKLKGAVENRARNS